jgi:hypothetical protein
MQILTSILLALGAFVSLALGLASVLRDLLDRSPHDAPLVHDDAWPRRYQGAPAQASPDQGYEWGGEREGGRI